MNRNLALSVEEHYPLTQASLVALCAYLEKAGWTRRGPWAFEKAIDGPEPVQVRVPATVSTPSLIEASETFADILLLVSIDEQRDLEEVIARVQEEQERQAAFLTEESLIEVLAERGYGYEERPSLDVSDLVGELSVYATRGEREAHYLGQKGLLIGTSLEQFKRGWAYQRLELVREDYLKRTGAKIAGVALREVNLAETALTPFARQVAEGLLTTLLFELQEAGEITVHRPLYGKDATEEKEA